MPKMVTISAAADWAAVAGDYQSLGLRKTDGSIWRWDFPGWDYRMFPFKGRPVRLGRRNDWVGVGTVLGGVVTLGADGALCYWWKPADRFQSWADSDQPMLAPSRKPAVVENIFADGSSR